MVILVFAALAIAPHFRRHEFTLPETAFEEENAEAFITAEMKRPAGVHALDVTVFVIGEVRRPGTFTQRGPLTLAEVIETAEPLASASRHLTLVRPMRPQAAVPTLPSAPDVLTLPTDRYDTTILVDGDTVYVPRARTFYILGEVRLPGAYVLEPNTSVAKAIALAGGLTDRGSFGAVSVSRLVKGKRRDVDVTTTDSLVANDVVRVGSRIF